MCLVDTIIVMLGLKTFLPLPTTSYLANVGFIVWCHTPPLYGAKIMLWVHLSVPSRLKLSQQATSGLHARRFGEAGTFAR